MRFVLNKETIESENCTLSEQIGEYKDKESAMAALQLLANAFRVGMDFKEGTEFGAEPAIWAWSVTDENGAKYYVTEEYAVGEDGVVEIDEFGFPVFAEPKESKIKECAEKLAHVVKVGASLLFKGIVIVGIFCATMFLFGELIHLWTCGLEAIGIRPGSWTCIVMTLIFLPTLCIDILVWAMNWMMKGCSRFIKMYEEVPTWYFPKSVIGMIIKANRN